MMLNRIGQLRRKLREKQLDAFLISNFYNILYLSGFKTLTEHEREAFLLVTKNSIYLFTDGRYLSKLKVKNEKLKVANQKLRLLTAEKGFVLQLQEVISEEKLARIGFEGDDLRVNELKRLKEKVSSAEFINTENLIIKLREIKNDVEINKIKKACAIGDQCLKEIIPLIKVGMTEKEIAFRIEYWLKNKNFNLAFPALVAVDANSSIPHYDTQSNGLGRIKRGSIITIDFGVNYQNYLSDMTRMVFFGKPTAEKLNIYNHLLNIQQSAMKSFFAKASEDKQYNNVSNLKDIDLYCRSQIMESGLPDYSHSTGHGVGLEIHEYPKVSKNSSDILRANQIFTIEPGVYYAGKWGMRIEDTVTINNRLEAEVLTNFDKKPTII